MHGESRYIFRKALKGILPNNLYAKHNTKYEPNRLKRLRDTTLKMVEYWESSDIDNYMKHNKFIDKDKLYKVLSQLKESNEDNIDNLCKYCKSNNFIIKGKIDGGKEYR